MAEFCNDECKQSGSICDFCKFYMDEYRDIKKIESFAGMGICDITKEVVYAHDGWNCDNFVCFRIF